MTPSITHGACGSEHMKLFMNSVAGWLDVGSKQTRPGTDRLQGSLPGCHLPTGYRRIRDIPESSRQTFETDRSGVSTNFGRRSECFHSVADGVHMSFVACGAFRRPTSKASVQLSRGTTCRSSPQPGGYSWSINNSLRLMPTRYHSPQWLMYSCTHG